jgi:endogenous inhibitor of DNA gyrase (YacG/DUF329 family)
MSSTGLSSGATLDLWQAADGLSPVARALTLAAAADNRPADELARLPIGQRDACVLALAPPVLEATVPCPACGEAAEFSLATETLLRSEGKEPAPTAVSWRSPDSRDVAAAAVAPDIATAERILLERCATSDLSAEARADVCRAMAEADPLAEVLVDVECPACATTFVADLDAAAFVWSGVRARALRLLREVDVLARAYGWTEAEVLALGDRRREAYLELVG